MLYLLLYPLHSHFARFRRSALRNLSLGDGRACGAGVFVRARTDSDRAFSRRACRPDDPRRSPADPSEESRHPDDGRTADPRLTPCSRRSCSPMCAILYVWIAIFVTVSFGAVGLADDMLKLRRGRGQGISGRTKLGWSFVVRRDRRGGAVRPDALRYASDDSVRQESASRSALVGLHPVRGFRDRRVVARGQPD